MIVLAVLVGGCILLVGMGAWFGMMGLNQIKPIVGCAITFESMHDAIKDYTAENNGKLPSAEKWQDELKPYVARHLGNQMKEAKKEGAEWIMKAMDVERDWGCYKGDTDNMTGIAFNKALSGKKVDDMESKSTTVILFEIEAPRKNANEEYKRRDEKDSPKIMGSPRGWFEVTWDRVEYSGDSNMNFDTGRRSRERVSTEPSNESSSETSTSEGN